jgi:hypothetical protein
MAPTIRQIGLKLIAVLARLLTRPAPRGWQRSARPPTLRGR